MKLLELYEDLFQYICRLNRAARTDKQPDYTRVRSEIKSLLEDINRKAAADMLLSSQAKKLELPIIFFVDNLICTSRLRWASQWIENRLAKEKNELAGDERFFDLLEEDLADRSEEAVERLAVYYVCLGLGFTGMHQGQPDQIQNYIEQILQYVRRWIDVDPRAKISEEAYRHTDTRVLTEPPGQKLVLVTVLFAFFCLTALAFYCLLYWRASSELNSSVNTILSNASESANP